MKKIYSCILIISLVIGLDSCKPYEEDAPGQGHIIAKEDIKISVTEDKETPNLFHFKLENQGIGIFKCPELGIDRRDSEFSQHILWAGDYTMTVQVYSKAGLSETTTITVSVPTNDPTLCSNQTLRYLTGGCDASTGKAWKLRSGSAGGGIILTRTITGEVWWVIDESTPDADAAYDDELTFSMDGAKAVLDNHGNSFMNEATGSLFPDGNTSGSFKTIHYKPSADARWDFTTSNNISYLKLIDVFPMYGLSPELIKSATYEIVEINENLLHIKYIVGTGEWDSTWNYYLVSKN